MAILVAQTAGAAHELDDQMGGRRRFDLHLHHPPGMLAKAVINGVEKIVQLRKEIEL